MKPDIHPKYNDKVIATCACGATFLVGSTEDELRVEICSNCHPFFTGKQKLVDTAGRVDKFRARVAASKKVESKGGGLSPANSGTVPGSKQKEKKENQPKADQPIPETASK